MQNTQVQQIQPRRFKFIDELVESFYDICDTIISNHVDKTDEKSIFMMFIVMYFTVHLKLKDIPHFNDHSKTEQKEVIKDLLEDAIKDPNKRRMCLQTFESKFRFLFEDSYPAIETNQPKRIEE